jgi:hypothetical protein
MKVTVKDGCDLRPAKFVRTAAVVIVHVFLADCVDLERFRGLDVCQGSV